MPFVLADVRKTINSFGTLFPYRVNHIRGFRGINASDAEEYAKLVARHPLSGQVDFSFDAVAGGTIFTVGKRDSDKLKEIWHGARVS